MFRDTNFCVLDRNQLHRWRWRWGWVRAHSMLKEIKTNLGGWTTMMRSRMFPLALLTFVSSSLLCGAQTATIDVADQSKVDCLARLAGEIELSESDVGGVHQTSYVDHITTTNLSKKPIMAMVIVSQISNSYGPMVQQYNELDAFFSHKLEIAPSQKYTHQHEDNGTFSMPVPQDVVDLMDTRADLFQALQKLDAAATEGDSEFLKALAVKSNNTHANSILNNIRDQQKRAAAVSAVREMLAVAATR